MAIEISTPQQLSDMRNDLTADYVLTQNIDMVGFDWDAIPYSHIADENNFFSGTLDGQGYTIFNLDIQMKSGQYYYGIFSYCFGAEIRNINFERCEMNFPTDDYKSNLGFVTGYAYNTIIENINVTDCTLNLTDRNGNVAFIAGMINIRNTHAGPYTDSIIRNCHVKNSSILQAGAMMNGSGTGIAGIVASVELQGQHTILIENCTVINDEDHWIEGGEYQCGGIASALSIDTRKVTQSESARVIVRNCRVETDFIYPSYGFWCYYTAGIVGYTRAIAFKYVLIENCHYVGDIKSIEDYYDTPGYSDAYNFGGVVGWTGRSDIKDCTAEGSIRGHYGVGGLVGYWYGYSFNSAQVGSITNCHFNGEVFGEEMVGGLIGATDESNFDMTYCSANAKIIGAVEVGGFFGRLSGTARVQRTWAVIDATIVSEFVEKEYIGGIVGLTGQDYQGSFLQEITDCYVRGTMEVVPNATLDSGTYYQFVLGGAFGYAYGDAVKVENVYSAVELVSTINLADFNVGSFWGYYGHSDGYDGCRIEDCYFNNELNPELPAVKKAYEYVVVNGNLEGRTTAEMTFEHASNTYLNWSFDDIWFIYPAEVANAGYPVLVEYNYTPEQKIYFLKVPEVRLGAPTATTVTVVSNTSEATARLDGVSRDREIERLVQIDEGDYQVCLTVAEKLLDRWSEETTTITGEIIARADIDFKKYVNIIVPEIGFNGILPVQKVAHDVLAQKTKITCGDIETSENEITARIIEKVK